MNQKVSQTLRMNEMVSLLKSQNKLVYQFGFGQSPFPVPDIMKKEIIKNCDNNKYLPVQGIKELRKSIANFYEKYTKHTINPDQIIIGPGSKELLFLFSLIFNGDVIISDSSWVSYKAQSNINKKKIIWYPSEFKDNWKIIPSKLDRLLEDCNIKVESGGKSSKYLILNSPCNPTGHCYDEQELFELSLVARKHNIIIISDEIYSELSFNKHYSISKYYDKTIVCNGISKFLSCGGWRLGFMIFPTKLNNILSKMLQTASESYSCVSSPIQYASIKGFDLNITGEYISNCKKILNEVANYIYVKFRQNNIEVRPSKGGFYIFPNFSYLPKADILYEEWCLQNQKSNDKINNVENLDIMCFSQWVFDKIFSEIKVACLPGCDFGRPNNELTCRIAYVDFDGKLLLEKCNNEKINQDFIVKYCPNIIEGIDKLINWWLV